ncbi:CTD small phosphatase-like protein 2 [Oryza brachyantha]|uniref:FCP1 homology domain-containing protein n=1 Tax=Oryza brachyantha TaxID=4533 RepID=J3KUH6_ORYBR|nr:CTD small phosphatase-like protein 2 [Oryza brachyantha]XP_015698937.1 CTD small phosphatase-like protein 2 [Oryza brachyantha]
MQTRKKGATRNAHGDPANTKTSRQPRRANQVAASEKKVNDLITSSAKKKKSVGVPSKKNRASKGGKKLISACDAADAENEVTQVVSGISSDQKRSDDNVDGRPCNSIFSPAYHHQKECGVSNFAKGLEHKGDTFGSAGSVEERTRHAQGRKEATTIRSESNQNNESTSHAAQTCVGSDHHTIDAQSTCCNTPLEEDEFSELGNLSSEVSAIYLAMQQSKLECIDEQSQDSISTEGYVDPDDTEEYDDFDPYAFIKDLPDLSLVVPKFRPVLLPKQTRSCPTTTLVLDLDETLVHSTLEPCEDADFAFPVYFNFREHTIYVRCRPYLKEFLERVASLFETIIFTASQSIYAEQLLNVLDPKRKLFRHRVYRDSCVYVEGNYLKDLTVLGRDLTRIMIVDNSPQAFGFQLDNGIPIESWFDDPNDQELLKLLPFLESLVGVEDVRPYIARKFNLREKVATASSLPMDLQM